MYSKERREGGKGGERGCERSGERGRMKGGVERGARGRSGRRGLQTKIHSFPTILPSKKKKLCIKPCEVNQSSLGILTRAVRRGLPEVEPCCSSDGSLSG